MKRFIPQFHKGGFPELYVVADTYERDIVSDPQPYHLANDEAEARNNGTFAQPQALVSVYDGWLGGLNFTPIKV